MITFDFNESPGEVVEVVDDGIKEGGKEEVLRGCAKGESGAE